MIVARARRFSFLSSLSMWLKPLPEGRAYVPLKETIKGFKESRRVSMICRKSFLYSEQHRRSNSEGQELA